jgi:hypothetical protein
MSESLYLILPYFNFLNYNSGTRNINIFLNNFKKYKNTKLVLVEGVYDKENQLPDFSNQVFKHIKLDVKNILWIKENLINIGVKSLPEDWKFFGWIDRDIEFINPKWANTCIDKLQTCDLLQPWSECKFLDKDDNPKEDLYFGINKRVLSYCYINNSTSLKPQYFIHGGHCWCFNRKFYDKIEKLCDSAIVGGGDGLLIACMQQKPFHPHYRYLGDTLKEYCYKFKDAKTDYMEEKILHHYHGEVKNRKYTTRYEVLYKHKFDPKTFLTYDENGVLIFSQEGKVLEEPLKEYFIERSEDS